MFPGPHPELSGQPRVQRAARGKERLWSAGSGSVLSWYAPHFTKMGDRRDCHLLGAHTSNWGLAGPMPLPQTRKHSSCCPPLAHARAGLSVMAPAQPGVQDSLPPVCSFSGCLATAVPSSLPICLWDGRLWGHSRLRFHTVGSQLPRSQGPMLGCVPHWTPSFGDLQPSALSHLDSISWRLKAARRRQELGSSLRKQLPLHGHLE